MIIEIFAVVLVVSAFMAVYLDGAIYSVVSLAVTMLSAAFLYLLNEAGFAALFQFAIGVGTLAVLFLSGEMLSEEPRGKKSRKQIFSAMAVALVVSTIPIFLSVGNTIPTGLSLGLQFSDTLWNLRAIDVVLQGLVIMTVALGVAIVLYDRRGERV
jgi:NADH:ubiquinone oxidoreductase subunit 6 (subunit J)